MKIIKKSACFVLILSLCLGLTSCSYEKPKTDGYVIEFEPSDTSNGTPSPTAVPTPDSTPIVTPLPTTEPMATPTPGPSPLPTAEPMATSTPGPTPLPEDDIAVSDPDDGSLGNFDHLDDDSDFSKVSWGVTYSLLEDMPGITASVTAFKDSFGYWYLIVGITNMYDRPLSLAGDAAAMDDNGECIGDTYVYLSNVGPGNTSVFKIYCPQGVPNGKIRWDNLSVKDGFKEYVPWCADWSLSFVDDDTLSVKYQIRSESDATPDNIFGLILDPNGFVIDIFEDTEFETGTVFTKENLIYHNGISDKPVRYLALFINPTIF